MAKQKNNIIGISQNEELTSKRDYVDLRTNGEKFRSWMVEGPGGPMMLMGHLGGMLFFPTLMEPLFASGMLTMLWFSKQRFRLPLRMPQSSNRIDYNDPKAGAGDDYAQASGIVFLGNEMGSNKELWVNASDAGTHFLVFGTTGAGKAIQDDAQVHTPYGWARADTLTVGDRVSTPDGRDAPIVGVFPQGKLDLYRLSLDDGRTVDVSGDHLWEIQPYRPSTPLQALAAKGAEVVNTLTLAQRLRETTWPADAQGWALPLPQAPEAPEAEWGHQMAQRIAHIGRALAGTEPFPEGADAGSRAQRQAIWDGLLELSLAQGQVVALGRGRQFTGLPTGCVAPVVRLARSLGFWAKVEPEGTVLVLEREGQVRVLHVEPLQVQAECRCFKIDDPRGLFLMDEYVVTHNTETLISMAYNALVQGSGFIYVDGKGDNQLFMKIFSLTRSALRDDDLLCINYMTGGRDVVGPQEDKLSNNMNPFISGTAGSLTQLLVSLMPEGGGDNAMWQGRAVAFISSLLMALCHLRDTGQMNLGIGQVREFLTLEKIQELSKRADLTDRIIESLEGYLTSLPGYLPNPPEGKQSDITNEQHGFLQMQFTRVMGSLADDYGYIFNTTRGEVDFRDVVLNNRILAVLLPSLEKSPEELGNLGKIIVASLKSMMATGLGDKVEGETAVIIDAKPTHAPNPFLCILDEYGYYVVKGAAVMPAQARSLNFSMVFAGQDYPSFKKNNNKEEAEATVANCNVVAFMKLMDTADTADLFMKLSGKARVVKGSGFERQNTAIGSGNYQMGQNASVSMEDRGSIEDLRTQLQGEAHIIFKRSMVRARMFYAAPVKPERMRLNHFLRVEPPAATDIAMLDQEIGKLQDRLNHPDRLDTYASDHALPKMLAVAVNTLQHQRKAGQSPVESALAALMATHRLPYLSAQQFGQTAHEMVQEDEEDEGGVTIWGVEDDLHFGEADDMGGLHGGVTGYSDPAASAVVDAPRKLHKAQTEEAIMQAEIASGVDPEEATLRSKDTIEAMAAVSQYPQKGSVPDSMDEANFDDLLTSLENDLEGHENQGSDFDV
jgi:intracellular multiplication protein IcmO